MARGLAFVGVLLMLGTALFVLYAAPREGDYFDPVLQSNSYPCSYAEQLPPERLHPSFESWFSGPLRDVGEPSLYLNKPADGTTTVRLVLLPSELPPHIVRIDDLYGDAPRLTAYRVIGELVPTSRTKRQRSLRAEETVPIRDLIASSGVMAWSPDSCLSTPDGGVIFMEANGPDGYRFINRLDPLKGTLYELGVVMFGLSGWPNAMPSQPTPAADA